MPRNPYSRFLGQRLTLNDYLAIDRTVLANERTLLAYGRTALALIVVGGSVLKFFSSPWMHVAGIAFMAIGAWVGLRGWARYLHTAKLLAAALSQETGAAAHPLAEEVKTQPPPTASKAESSEPPCPT